MSGHERRRDRLADRRHIARELGVDSDFGKTPAADLESLRPGRPDEEVFGFTYDDIDDFLEGRAVEDVVSQAILDRYQVTVSAGRRGCTRSRPHYS